MKLSSPEVASSKIITEGYKSTSEAILSLFFSSPDKPLTINPPIRLCLTELNLNCSSTSSILFLILSFESETLRLKINFKNSKESKLHRKYFLEDVSD